MITLLARSTVVKYTRELLTRKVTTAGPLQRWVGLNRLLHGMLSTPCTQTQPPERQLSTTSTTISHVSSRRKSIAIADGLRDALRLSKSCQLLQNCSANPYQTEVMELDGYSWPTCSKQPQHIGRRSVVNKLDRQQLLLTTRWTGREKIL